MAAAKPSPSLGTEPTQVSFDGFRLGPFVFKLADSSEEIEEVHRINYETFVREVSQYDDDGSGRLVDKFVEKNIYLICKLDEEAVGMVAVHDEPPFSVVSRLENPRILGQLCSRPLEVRLLTVRTEHRNSLALPGLLYAVYRFAESGGYSHLLASGITGQLELYEKIGFRPLGPPIESGGAAFAPMVLELADLPASKRKVAARFNHRSLPAAGAPAREPQGVSLLPGPANIAPQVREAFERPLLYHRSDEFVAVFEEVRAQLSELACGMDVAVLNGSGSLANDLVAACLRADRSVGPGLVLVNGEFGERLCAQTERAGLEFDVVSWEWGKPWRLQDVLQALETDPGVDWIWGVHQESSTGVLNDAEGLVQVADRYGCRVMLDAVSSIGAVPIPDGVSWVSGVSGKCLGGMPGICFVFVEPGGLDGVDSRRLPSYMDVAEALAAEGTRFTFPSPVLFALRVALAPYGSASRRRQCYERYTRLGRYVREHLRDLGIEPLAPESAASPVITTFEPPDGYGAEDFVEACRSWGFELAAHSRYLAERGWVQIGTLGDIDEACLERYFLSLEELLSPRRP